MSALLCRRCGKSEHVVAVKTLAALASCTVGGRDVSLVGESVEPQHLQFSYCHRCGYVIERPTLQTETASNCIVVYRIRPAINAGKTHNTKGGAQS